MKFRSLGKTGLKVSELGFGCWAIGGDSYGTVKDEDSLEALETAWASGVNFYDTADTYGEGHSETLLGRFLKSKPRSQMIIASKVGWDFYPDSQKHPGAGQGSSEKVNHVGHKKNFNPTYIRFACEQSLQRLKTEYIDLYQLHNPSLEVLQQGQAMEVFEKLKQEGKIRFIGVSVHTEAEAVALLKDDRVEALQLIFNLLDQRMADKVFDLAAQRNVGVIVREPLASGLLTGKYPPGYEFPKNDHRRRWLREKREYDWEKIRMMQQVLAGKDIPLGRAALEFVLSFKNVSTVIPGAKTKAQALENAEAVFNPRLQTQDFQDFKEIYVREEIFKKGLNPR